MHIPDGFLDTKTIIATTTLAVVGIGTAWRQTKQQIPPRHIPMLGLAAAFVFAAQMLNFPVAGGTSGHLMGAALTAVLLGPNSAIIVMSSVLVVQCFLFADGGVLALGANIFNMALIGVGVGYSLYRAIIRIIGERRGGIAAVAIASWGSVVAASLCCAGELAWSGTVSWKAAFPAMAGIHSLIGLGEALITTLVITAVKNARPELLAQNSAAPPAKNTGTFIIYGIVISLGLVLFVSPFASEWPDGLEAVAAKFGFDSHAVQHPVVPGIIPDYRFPGIDSPAAATIAAGVAGIAILLVVMLLLTRHMKDKT